MANIYKAKDGWIATLLSAECTICVVHIQNQTFAYIIECSLFPLSLAYCYEQPASPWQWCLSLEERLMVPFENLLFVYVYSRCMSYWDVSNMFRADLHRTSPWQRCMFRADLHRPNRVSAGTSWGFGGSVAGVGAVFFGMLGSLTFPGGRFCFRAEGRASEFVTFPGRSFCFRMGRGGRRPGDRDPPPFRVSGFPFVQKAG